MTKANETESNIKTSSLVLNIDSYISEEEKLNPAVINSNEFVNQTLSTESLSYLYQDILEYRKNYQIIVDKYKGKHTVLESELIYPSSSLKEYRFFREQFVLFMEEINQSKENKYQGADLLRQIRPELATIKLENLLGSEGVKLYHLALEEEANSLEYMNAVFQYSTTHYEGEKWAKRPVVIVAGPSASGKSFAAQVAVKHSDQFLPKIHQNNSGNQVVAIDGGNARAVSQMRKLVIQVANNKGYTGVKDLQSHSNILEKVKTRLFKTASSMPNLGMVIPETFSDYASPLSKSRRMLKFIQKIPNSQCIFCQVVGNKNALFQKVVAYIGSQRAWKTSNFNNQPLNLNKKNLCESKAYGAKGFLFGQYGSHSARKDYEKNSNANLSMLITNDLVLKKEQDGQWVNANEGDENVVLVSQRVFDAWIDNNNIGTKKSLSLTEFMRTSSSAPLIQSSLELSFKIACANLNSKFTKEFNPNIINEKQEMISDTIKIICFIAHNALENPSKAYLKITEKINYLKEKLNYTSKELLETQSILKKITDIRPTSENSFKTNFRRINKVVAEESLPKDEINLTFGK